MNGEQLFQKLSNQFKGNISDSLITIKIDEDLEGEIDISEIILKVLKNKLDILNDRDFLLKYRNNLANNCKVIINANFEHIIIGSFPKNIIFQSNNSHINENGETDILPITGISLLIKDDHSIVKLDQDFEIIDALIGTINIRLVAVL